MIRIGTAGWSIPKNAAEQFGGAGSHLERYARVLHCAEINSSFYRPPMLSTWKKWAAAVPAGFQFAVKAPRAITHEARLACEPEVLREFLSSARLLGEALGPILFQLPPSLAYDARVAVTFFSLLRREYEGLAALEPRHVSWFTPQVAKMLREQRVARVAADPARVPEAGVPGGFDGLVYYRLHGSPRMYYSPYGEEYLHRLASLIAGREAWVIFDNTASGAAIHNALELSSCVAAVDWMG
jgi:uncharacterized protein YecE (DUF72 family)